MSSAEPDYGRPWHTGAYRQPEPDSPGKATWKALGRDVEGWDRHARGDHRLCSPVGDGEVAMLDSSGSPAGCLRAGED